MVRNEVGAGMEQPELTALTSRLQNQHIQIHDLLNDIQNRLDFLKYRDEPETVNMVGTSSAPQQTSTTIMEHLHTHNDRLAGAIDKLSLIYARLSKIM